MISDDVFYYFGRLNLICPFRGREKSEYIYNSLKSKIQVLEREFKWGFFNVEKIEQDQEHLNNFIYGILVKYKTSVDEEIVDEENSILRLTSVPDKTVAKSVFIIHLETGIIAYHPIVNCINNEQFKKQFCKLFEVANNNILVDAEIQAIDDENKIFDSISEFDKITSLTITLHPSNPSNRDRWKKTDEKLHAMNIERYTENYIGKNGIIIDEDSDTYGNIIMAGDGYGIAEIRGIKDGNESSASTQKIPIKEKAPKENSQLILENLLPHFKKIFERFKKHEN